MSNDATPTLGGFGSGPSEVSVNQRGYPTVNGVDGAGWRRPSPVAVAQWSSRRRRVVFSLLAGVRLAAGGAALILLGWGIAEALRSSLPVPLVSGSWSNFNLFPLIFIILSVVARVQRPPRLPAGGIVGCAVGGSVIVSILLFLYTIADGTLDRIVRAGAIVPEYIGLVAVGWVCLVLALLSHLALRVYPPGGGRAAPPPRPPGRGGGGGAATSWGGAATSDSTALAYGRIIGSSLASSQQPQYVQQATAAARKPVGQSVRDVGMSVICIAVVTVIAVTVPGLISSSYDHFVRVTTSAAADHDDFPTVEEMASATAGKTQVDADPLWTAPFDRNSVDQILAGVRGAVVVTGDGVYGLDSSTGKALWTFATTKLNDQSSRGRLRPLKGVRLYGGRSAFTSPDGAWLAYAFDVSPDSAFNDSDSGKDVTRVVVLSTDTGRVALDTQVTGATPAVQLTDSKTVINRKVYETAGGRELTPLDEEKAAIPGPGGHSSVVVRDKQEDSQYQRPVIDLEALPNAGSSSGSYLSSRRIRAQVVAGQPVNVGGWIVNAAKDGTVENIDSGGTVSLKGEDKPDNWTLVAIQASAQAVSAWTVQDEVEGKAKEFGHPLVLNVFDTRSGKVTAVDPAGTYRTIEQDGDRSSSSPYSGAVDTPVFSARVDDENHHSFSDQLVVPQNDAARQDAEQDGGATDSGGHEPAWVSVSLPRFWVNAGPVALCPGGVIVSDDSRSSASAVVAGRKAPQR
jgi:membrane protein